MDPLVEMTWSIGLNLNSIAKLVVSISSTNTFLKCCFDLGNDSTLIGHKIRNKGKGKVRYGEVSLNEYCDL